MYGLPYLAFKCTSLSLNLDRTLINHTRVLQQSLRDLQEVVFASSSVLGVTCSRKENKLKFSLSYAESNHFQIST